MTPTQRLSAPLTFRTLDLRVRRRLQGMRQGDHAGLRLGPGSEPEEVVRYRPGEDDVRRIDWNVSARSQEPHVWRTRADHELDTWLLLDETASMDFGTADLEKADLAAQAAAALGLLTDGPGNRLGVARLRADRLDWTAPLPGRHAAHRLLRSRERERARRTPSTPVAAASGLGEALREFSSRGRHGLRVVVSDLVEPDGRIARPFGWEPPLRRIAARHDTVVVEVVDPRELTLPDVGPVVLEDPETGHRCEVWTSLPRLRQAYADAAATHRREIAAAIRSAGAEHVQLRTDRDWVGDLARFVLRRRRPIPRRVR